MSMHRSRHSYDETARRQWQNPENILHGIGLKPGSTLMDIGCGNGFFTLPAARIAGPGGKVYGLDISGEAIEEVRQKAAAENLANIELKAGRAEDTVFCQACADIIFFGIVLHDFQDPAAVLQNAHRMIKPHGILANLDWKKISMNWGPPLSKRFDEARASSLIEAAGFKIKSVRDSGEFHYIIIAEPA